MMRIIAGLAALFLLVLLVLPARAAEDVRRVALYHNPPLMELDGTLPRGFLVDVIRALAARQGWTPEFVQGSFSEGFDALKAGTLDLMAGVAWSEGRADMVAFGTEPVIAVWGQLYSPPGRLPGGLTALNGATIAVAAIDVFSAQLTGLCARAGFLCYLRQAKSPEEAIALAAEGSVEAVLLPSTLGAVLAPAAGLEPGPVAFNPYRLHFAAPKSADGALLAALDVELARAREEDAGTTGVSFLASARVDWFGAASPSAAKTTVPAAVEIRPLEVVALPKVEPESLSGAQRNGYILLGLLAALGLAGWAYLRRQGGEGWKKRPLATEAFIDLAPDLTIRRVTGGLLGARVEGRPLGALVDDSAFAGRLASRLADMAYSNQRLDDLDLFLHPDSDNRSGKSENWDKAQVRRFKGEAWAVPGGYRMVLRSA